MSEFEHISVRYEHVDNAGSVAIATVLAPELKDELTGTAVGTELSNLVATKPSGLVVNLSRVNALSSSSIAQLVKVWKQSKADEVELVLTELNELLVELFRVVRLEDEIKIVSPEQRAISLAATPAV